MEQLLKRRLLGRKNLFVLKEITKLIKFSSSSDKIRHRSTIVIVILGKFCISSRILDNNPWLTVVEECNLALLLLDFESLFFNLFVLAFGAAAFHVGGLVPVSPSCFARVLSGFLRFP